ncbi:uncharacterized protein EDB91DRAFT_1345052 [Suillus paluster]|uniref:uncharacterized protein n=1 Tax=Suillus paluster TaxID=48578 RepID=UPI001B873E87|nr:uncharacterized protein EDB91DRAFT_1345052 [Suillus paluster]KAG1747853.1 hypothetical protein EDB91DRAFT_1345052 [Suillus paluster]
MPDLATSPYSQACFPNINYSAIELKDQSIVTEHQQQLDAVLHEISVLETVMDSTKNLHQQLVEKKDKITQSMNLHKKRVSTFRRLPIELLCQIFVHCLPESNHLSPASNLAPMLLTRICRRWREVAVGIPNLWSSLRLEVGRRDWQRKALCYDLWLKRSRGTPLSLALQCYGNNSTKLRSLLQPYSSQISSFSIYFIYDVDKPQLVLTDLPKLQELTVVTHDRSTTPAIAHSISQLPSTLRSLRVIGPLFDLELLSYFNPIWANLTHVEIATRHPNVFLHLLHLCPDLSSLTIRAAFNQIQALEPFTHTKLQSLRINYDSTDTKLLSHLFNTLSLPNLRVLEACCVQPWPHEELKALLARSNCPLESLIFGAGVVLANEQRAEYVVLVPSLEVIADPKHLDCFAY